MRSRLLNILFILLALVSALVPAFAQGKKPASKPQPKTPQKSEKQIADDLAKSRAEVVSAANEYKKSIEGLIVLYERDAKAAEENVERLKALLADGIISKLDVEKEQQKLTDAQNKIAQARRQIVEADSLVAEVAAAEQLAKLPPPRVGGYTATSTIIRYSGPSKWLIADAGKLQGFFQQRFGRTLPISAFGQSQTHDRMGYDHRNSIDVALHPDSAEGQALMSFLRSQGIPFLAFRGAVPGSATGPHIHVGPPSKRFGR
jgi:hypothetical protein